MNPPTAALRQAHFSLRVAEPKDVPEIVGLIRELAEFEKLAHLVQVTPELLAPHLFGSKPVAEAVVVEVDAQAQEQAQAQTQTHAQPKLVAFALFFPTLSTFLGKPGLYLEDLYVQPAFRQQGIGRALLRHLATLASQRGCGRFEWSVLDWNTPAIRVYESLGAKLLPEWRICRVNEEALDSFAR